MNYKMIVTALAVFALSWSASAQKVEMPKYQRSSLHMVLLETDTEALSNSTAYVANKEELAAYWGKYPFPEKYDSLVINLKGINAGAPKGSLIALINEYQGRLDQLSITEAKDLMSKLTSGKEYNKSLVECIEKTIQEEKIGNQIIRKWYNIKDDGSWDWNLIERRAGYNASQADIAKANATTRGVRGIIDEGDNLLSNTFVTFSKLELYESEPVAAFVRDLALIISAFLPGPASLAGNAAAQTAYLSTKNGYTANTTTALYRLDWNEEVKGTFESMFKGDKIDMAAFNAYTFPMTFVGIDKASSMTIDAAGGFKELVGKDGKPDSLLIQQTMVRNIDKILAKMQGQYEVFAPACQIISTNPVLLADMGMKEGLEGGESFNLLEPVYNEKTQKTEWKSIGVVKVDKKQIWDNRYSLVDSGKKEDTGVKGTVLSANKKAAPGMVVRQVVKPKKEK